MKRIWKQQTVCALAIGALACGVWTGCKSNGSGSSTKPMMAADSVKEGFWGTFPENAAPKTAGDKVVKNLLARPTIESRNYGVIYPEVCASYGSIRFVAALQQKDLLDQLVMRYQGMLNPPGGRAPSPGGGAGADNAGQPRGGGGGGGGRRGQGAAAASAPATQAAAPTTQGRGNRRGGGGGGGGGGGLTPATGTATNMVPVADHVDRSVFGTLPLEIYRQTGDKRYLEIGKKSADDQWINPIEGGLTNQTRWWIDDMFMITALQSAAARATKDPIYVDHGAKQMAAYLDKLQQPNGLFFHADDAHFYWGRGAGWVAAGLTELLSVMPENHPLRPRILDGYRKMMAGLLKVQAPSGMWRQLLDNPDSWEETSGTGMFTFAMATGVKRGWLDAKEYKEPAKKAWIALAGYLDEQGRVRDVCVGTNKGYTTEYYLQRGKNVGDLHGQAAFIWAAYAMLDK